MSKFLKGNYDIPEDSAKETKEKQKDFTKIFESKALEKLGGSIAFVMKKDQFIWEEEDGIQ